jgi:hypothetical protein
MARGEQIGDRIDKITASLPSSSLDSEHLADGGVA